jgi:hypothetical protein
MKRIQKYASVFCLSVFLFGCLGMSVGNAGTMDLISTLVDKLGISKQQAEGGTGALFQNAKDNLSTEDFSKLAEAVPEATTYLDAAPKAESKKNDLGGALGSTLSALGGDAAKAGSMLDLKSAFSKLGMDSGTLGKFVPVVLDFVQSEGGQSVMGLLKGLW